MALERELVQFCAPTLAGLKTGSVFSVGYESEEELRKTHLYVEPLTVGTMECYFRELQNRKIDR